MAPEFVASPILVFVDDSPAFSDAMFGARVEALDVKFQQVVVHRIKTEEADCVEQAVTSEVRWTITIMPV